MSFVLTAIQANLLHPILTGYLINSGFMKISVACGTEIPQLISKREVNKMNTSLDSLFQEKNKVIHIFGTPGTYKTSFLVQLIMKKLQEGVKQIYLIDVSSNFPYTKLESIKELLSRLIVFQPKSLRETVDILDNLEVKGVKEDTVLLIHDIFHRMKLEAENDRYLISYLVAIVRSISKSIKFPIFLTNQGRAFENAIHPLHETIMFRYLEDHLLFEKPKNKNKILISRFSSSRYEYFTEVLITTNGLSSFFPSRETLNTSNLL
jgi:hypothetical protein